MFTLPQATKHSGLPEAGIGKERSPLRGFVGPANTLILDFYPPEP